MSQPVAGAVPLQRIDLPPTLNDWWLDTPRLDDPIIESEPSPALLEALEPQTEINVQNTWHEWGISAAAWIYEKNKLDMITNNAAKWWDRTTLPFVSKLATPGIVIGSLMIIVALAAGITSMTGISIPGLEILIQNMPVSLAVSLIVIRTGVHLIYQGLVLSKRKGRFRLEAQEVNKLYRIENNVNRLTEDQKKARLQEIHWLNQKLAPELQIQNMIEPSQMYGKCCTDLNSGRIHAEDFRRAVAAHLQGVLPDLPPPRQDLQGISRKRPKALDLTKVQQPDGWDRWYDWWHAKLPALGFFDMILGQCMVVTAGIAILCVAFPGSVPSAFDVIANDPYLSVSVSCLMLLHWINCTRTGWRMLTYNKREDKRTAAEEELQLIDLGLEKRNVKKFKQNIIHQLKQQKNEQNGAHIDQLILAITRDYKRYRPLLAPLQARLERVMTRWRSEEMHAPTFFDKVHKVGKKYVPSLAKPSIVLGIIVTLVGLTCLGLTISGHVPTSLDFLAKNTPISLLFSFGLLLSGSHAIHRGATLSERGTKEKWKGSTESVRKAFIYELFHKGYPQLPPPKLEKVSSQRTLGATIEITAPQPQSQEVRERLAQSPPSGGESIWIASLKTMAIPDVVLGIFFLFSSLAGLSILMGAPVPSHFDFILKDPSFSLSFCVSLLALGIDALSTSFRMATYQARKLQDKTHADTLKTCFEQLFPQKSLPEQALKV